MNTLIDKIKTLPLISQKIIGSETVTVTFTFNLPSSIDKILGIEKELGCRIPEEYRIFLLACDGCSLYNYDNIDGLKLLSSSEIVKYTDLNKDIYEDEWDNNIIIFGEIIGEGNYLGFKIEKNNYIILDCFHEIIPNEWNKINLTFNELIGKYIDSNGEKIWFNYETE